MQGRITAAATKAMAAFWASVAKDFPEAESGDFSPEATMSFEAACFTAVDRWAHDNVQPPDGIDDEGICGYHDASKAPK